MLRVKILASAVPLVLAGAIAGGELLPGTSPCITVGGLSLQVATAPWQSQSHVSFTNDPATATVRVQIVDSADIADFVVIDDMDTSDSESCTAGSGVSFVGISDHAALSDPVIYLSQDGGADYRIFVQSRSFTAKDAAALVVGAGRRTAAQRTAAL